MTLPIPEKDFNKAKQKAHQHTVKYCQEHNIAYSHKDGNRYERTPEAEKVYKDYFNSIFNQS